MGSETRRADGTVDLFGSRGWSEVFSIRLVEARGGAAAELRTTSAFHQTWLRAGDATFETGADARERLLSALRHHRPSIRLRLDAGGGVAVDRGAAASRHESCARRLLGAPPGPGADEGGTADAAGAPEPGTPLRELGDPVEVASFLLQLIRLPLPRAPAPRWAPPEAGQRLAPPGNQWDRRHRRMVRDGYPVRLQFAIRGGDPSPAARLCRFVRVPAADRALSESCDIQGYVSRSDGWPLAISVTRRVEEAGDRTAIGDRYFTRLVRLEGFVPPPDPCPGGDS